MTRNNDYIKAAFVIYNETISLILNNVTMKRDPELFAKLIQLNNEHLIENLNKALVLFKDKEK